MNLKNYYLSLTPAARAELAVRCGTTIGHLRNVVYGRRCGLQLAINLERESARAVTCEELRPDVYWAFIRGTKYIQERLA